LITKYIHNNNAGINNNCGRTSDLFCSSKFPLARERISSKFIKNFGSRLQKVSSALDCRHSYGRVSFVRISEITDEACWFRNFGPKCEYVKYLCTDTELSPLSSYIHIHYKVNYICVLCVWIIVVYTVL